MDVFLSDVELKGHAILFEDIKRRDANQQSHFIGVTIYYNGHEAQLDCVHGVNGCISSKRKRMENKIKEVIFAVL